MIIYKLKSAVQVLMALLVALMCNSGVNAGTYKHITVDGNLSDWAGVPVAYTQAPDTTQSIAYTNISAKLSHAFPANVFLVTHLWPFPV